MLLSMVSNYYWWYLEPETVPCVPSRAEKGNSRNVSFFPRDRPIQYQLIHRSLLTRLARVRVPVAASETRRIPSYQKSGLVSVTPGERRNYSSN